MVHWKLLFKNLLILLVVLLPTIGVGVISGKDCLAALGTAIGEPQGARDASLAEGVAAVDQDLGQASLLIVFKVAKLAF